MTAEDGTAQLDPATAEDRSPQNLARPRIAFFGIGNMGWPMAKNLVAAGLDVTVVDATPELARRLEAQVGGRAAEDPVSAVTRAEVVVTMLPTSRHVEDVFETCLDAVRPGSLLIEMSSGVPGRTQALARQLAARGASTIDAPVSGGVARAASGELSIMIGGSDPDVIRATPVLEVLGTALHRCGPLGAGQATKALNNLVSAAGLLISIEALLVGQGSGLDPSVLLDVLNVSTGMNNSTKSKLAPFVLSRSFDSGFGLDLMVKDLSTALDVAHASGMAVPFASACREHWAAAASVLGSGRDHTEIARFSEQLAGGELGRTTE